MGTRVGTGEAVAAASGEGAGAQLTKKTTVSSKTDKRIASLRAAFMSLTSFFAELLDFIVYHVLSKNAGDHEKLTNS